MCRHCFCHINTRDANTMGMVAMENSRALYSMSQDMPEECYALRTGIHITDYTADTDQGYKILNCIKHNLDM